MANHHELTNFIWQIADLLRGPYRPPQYERVMLPMTVLRRFDCVLAPSKEKVLADYERPKGGKLNADALDILLNNTTGQRFHNHSPLTFEKLKGDPDNIDKHLVSYINGHEKSDIRKWIIEIVKAYGSMAEWRLAEWFDRTDFKLLAPGQREPPPSNGSRVEVNTISRTFDNADFGDTRVTVERPLRLRYVMDVERKSRYLNAAPYLLDDVQAIDRELGREQQMDWNVLAGEIEALLKKRASRWKAPELKLFRSVFAEKDMEAEPVRSGPDRYEPDSDLRDFESVLLTEDVEEYFRRAVLPHVPDAWMDKSEVIMRLLKEVTT